jgi:hypothetical protein
MCAGPALPIFGPDGNELVPLVYILANYRLECTQDLPGQFLASFPIA